MDNCLKMVKFDKIFLISYKTGRVTFVITRIQCVLAHTKRMYFVSDSEGDNIARGDEAADEERIYQ